MIKLSNALITDSLPQHLTEQPHVQALAYAINQQIKKVLEYEDNARVYAGFLTCSSRALDMMAFELQLQDYKETMPIDQKRAIVAAGWYAFCKLGTKGAVDKLCSALFDANTYSTEWFKYNGSPGHFKVIIENGEITPESKQYFYKVIGNVKRLSAWLDYIEFVDTYEDTLTATDTDIVTVNMPHDDVYPYPWRFDGSWHFTTPESYNNLWFLDGQHKHDGIPLGAEDDVPKQVKYLNGDYVFDGSWILWINKNNKILFNHYQGDLQTCVEYSNEDIYKTHWLFDNRNKHDGAWKYKQENVGIDDFGVVIDTAIKLEDTLESSEDSFADINTPHTEDYCYPWTFNGKWGFEANTFNDTWCFNSNSKFDGLIIDNSYGAVNYFDHDHEQEAVTVNNGYEESYKPLKLFDRKDVYFSGLWIFQGNDTVNDSLGGEVFKCRRFYGRSKFDCASTTRFNGSIWFSGFAKFGGNNYERFEGYKYAM